MRSAIIQTTLIAFPKSRSILPTRTAAVSALNQEAHPSDPRAKGVLDEVQSTIV